jgi:hypothetical protein
MDKLNNIEKPILKISEIKPETYELKAYQLDAYKEWCLTALRSVDQS